jgi:hypothetical protein
VKHNCVVSSRERGNEIQIIGVKNLIGLHLVSSVPDECELQDVLSDFECNRLCCRLLHFNDGDLGEVGAGGRRRRPGQRLLGKADSRRAKAGRRGGTEIRQRSLND